MIRIYPHVDRDKDGIIFSGQPETVLEKIMIEKNSEGLLHYEFPHISMHTDVVHGLFTRQGGRSTGPYQGLNLGTATGDSEDAVRENKELIRNLMGATRVVTLKQVHGTGVFCWGRDRVPDGRIEADAVVTDEKNVLLMIKTADCQAVLLFDPEKKVAAGIHSGWRGSVADIIGKTVTVMKERYGSDPSRILAGIGPSLGPCCAEFVNYKTEIPERYWAFKDGKNRFDFLGISRSQLEQAGVQPEHIRDSGFCTACAANKDLFFSYRRDKLTGRLANVIGLK
jgi:YfiH family protein